MIDLFYKNDDVSEKIKKWKLIEKWSTDKASWGDVLYWSKAVYWLQLKEDFDLAKFICPWSVIFVTCLKIFIHEYLGFSIEKNWLEMNTLCRVILL